jgi:hypothetical protein
MPRTGFRAAHPVMHPAKAALQVIKPVEVTDSGPADTVQQDFLKLFLKRGQQKHPDQFPLLSIMFYD